ncbi:MAG: hypothetical protein HYS13_15925 [Planctomycetia bacterium]|nr:hypothetical protein [Planctomycetia bacterium]
MKRRRRLNKSHEIRDYKRLHRGAGPTAIAEALTARGIKVSPSQVSTALFNAKKLKRRGRRVAASANGRRGRRPAKTLSADLLLATKRVADQLGGIDRVRSALELLERLR